MAKPFRKSPVNGVFCSPVHQLCIMNRVVAQAPFSIRCRIWICFLTSRAALFLCSILMGILDPLEPFYFWIISFLAHLFITLPWGGEQYFQHCISTRWVPYELAEFIEMVTIDKMLNNKSVDNSGKMYFPSEVWECGNYSHEDLLCQTGWMY